MIVLTLTAALLGSLSAMAIGMHARLAGRSQPAEKPHF